MACWAVAVNDSGHVAGYAPNAENVIRAFLWRPGTGMVDLGSLNGSPDGQSDARGINRAGQIVGGATRPGLVRAFLWENGAMRDLGALPESDNTRAYAINAAGQVVGELVSPPLGAVFAVLWQNGFITPLASLGGDVSRATAISDAGHIAGLSGTSAGVVRAVLWRHRAARPLTPAPLVPTRPATPMESHRVGGGRRVLQQQSRPVRALAPLPVARGRRHGRPQHPAAPNWVTLNTAAAINDAGQIVGTGVHGFEFRAYLLTPAPAPPPTGVVHVPIQIPAPFDVAANPTTNRVYVANATDSVTVIDGATNADVHAHPGGRAAPFTSRPTRRPTASTSPTPAATRSGDRRGDQRRRRRDRPAGPVTAGIAANPRPTASTWPASVDAVNTTVVVKVIDGATNQLFDVPRYRLIEAWS